MSECSTSLDYMVWRYLLKEAPSLAPKFKRLKNIEEKGEPKITLASIYVAYTKNKPGGRKRAIEQDIKSVNKKLSLNENETNDKGIEKSGTSEEDLSKSDSNKKKIDTSGSVVENQNSKDEMSAFDNEACPAQKKDVDSATESTDKTSLLNEENSAKQDLESDDKREKKSLLTKLSPEEQKSNKKKPLLPDPNAKKPLLSGLVPTIEPSGRKTLLTEPLYGTSRIERKPLLSVAPMYSHPEDERARQALLSEPSQFFLQEERPRKPLLMEPVPPPLMQERIDRMMLLDTIPQLPHSYDSGINERAALLNHPLLPDHLDASYRRKRKSLLDEPPPLRMTHDFMNRKEKESLLMDPYENQGRKVELLNVLPLSRRVEDDRKRKKRALLPDRSPPRELVLDSCDIAVSSDHRIYNRKERNSSELPSYVEMQEYDDSSHLYSRRVRAKEPSPDTLNWKAKTALLSELENYLKKRLRNSSERNNPLTKQIDIQDIVDKSSRISNPSRMSPDYYDRYSREEIALLARKESQQYQRLSRSFGFAENVRPDKPKADLPIRKERASYKKEALIPVSARERDFEDSPHSIDFIRNESDLSYGNRRANEKERHPYERDIPRFPYERRGGKMGFL